jgi:hypothetical protein
MKKRTVMTAVLLLMSSVAVQAASEKTVSMSKCEGLDADGIAAKVKQDYTQNRINQWADDQKTLGQIDPVAWINPRDVTGAKDKWKVPLTVRGTNTDLHYVVTVDCAAGSATYRAQ